MAKRVGRVRINRLEFVAAIFKFGLCQPLYLGDASGCWDTD